MLPNKNKLVSRSNLEQKAIILTEIREFTQHPSLVQLMKAFGFQTPHKDASLENKLTVQKEFTNTQWDFRKGKERSDAQKIKLSEEEKKTILHAAKSIGLIKKVAPHKKYYDAIIIPSGIGMSLFCEHNTLCIAKQKRLLSLL